MPYACRPLSVRPRAADRRHQRIVRVLVDLDQEELELGRHDRLPAARVVELQHPPQHPARRDLDRAAIGVIAVADHLGGRLGVPGHEADRVLVRPHIDVGIGRADHVLVVGVLARHRLDEDRLGQAETALAQDAEEFFSRQDLAARDPGHVRDEAFDFGDLMALNEITEQVHINDGAGAPPAGSALLRSM